MSLFGWIKKLLTGSPPLERKFSGGQVCPYCGEHLWSQTTTWCSVCRADWFDPSNVIRTSQPRQPTLGETPTLGINQSAGGDAAGNSSSSVAKRQNVELTALDLSQFAPLDHGDVKKEARSLGSLWGNPWFGRRDVIPPVSDERTSLIDRAMVGQGLITPEELAEIHEVGREMDEIRPDLALASKQARAAVDRSKDELRKLKEAKKREAAQRRQAHDEAVALRRRTDIVFLGRGVSRGLADRRSNVEKLQAAGLPVMATPAELADALEVEIPRLRWLAWHSEASTVSHYISFEVPKKSGGVRRLSSPHREMRHCQDWIFAHILAKVPTHDAAHGFVRSRSTLTNAEQHVGQEVVVNADLSDFFPTITFPRVQGMFHELGYSPAAATILGLLCTECPRRTVEYAGERLHVATGPRGLPQGACTSPTISNLIARSLDRRLTAICERLGWKYTRYADDMSFSASGEAGSQIGYLLARVRHIAQDEGFRVNESKTRVLRRSASQNVTGIVVNDRPGVPRKTVRRLRAILHEAGTRGLEAANRDNHPYFESWLQGMIAYVAMVNPDQAAPLQHSFRELTDSAS